jgi:hypothetical protein
MGWLKNGFISEGVNLQESKRVKNRQSNTAGRMGNSTSKDCMYLNLRIG